MARKKSAPAPVSESAPLVATPVDPFTDPLRLQKQQRLYALAGKPEYAEEFEALRAELAAA